MDFKKYLQGNVRSLDREIEEILEKSLPPVAKDFISSCQGGKRIRGVLVKLGYELAHPGGVRAHLPGEIIKIAAAYEIAHAAILVHDDIMDQSKLRRGQASLYQKVGVSKAITLGDLGFFLAMRIISESNFPELQKNQALLVFAKTLMDTAIGQMMDLAGQDKIATAKLKTARYTISGPLEIGAVLAGAESDLLDQLDQFGENLGIAFQIKDDILDGELKDINSDALKYINRGKKIIPKITGNQKLRKLLWEMAEYMIEREK